MMSKIYCGCGNEIPEGRLKILPNTKTCVACSNTNYKKAIVTQLGEGDHTCTELFVVDEKEYDEYYNKNFSKKYKRKDTLGE
jgi:RNA polymerase-binding transcription factor DksA